jgi:hypothetical protein
MKGETSVLRKRTGTRVTHQVRSIAGSDLILALVSAVLGVIIATWFGSNRNGVAPSWLLFAVLCVIVALIALLVTKMNEVKQAIDRASPKGLSNVRVISVPEVSTIAANLMPSAKVIRIIGTARQDVVATDKVAMSYLRATERRVKMRPKLYYRRITSTKLQPAFRSHLERILTAAATSGHDIQIALIGDFECSISYQIFDESHALLVVDSPTIPGVRDNNLAFLIEERSMVAALISHFDNAWVQRIPFKSVEDLRAANSRTV